MSAPRRLYLALVGAGVPEAEARRRAVSPAARARLERAAEAEQRRRRLAA